MNKILVLFISLLLLLSFTCANADSIVVYEEAIPYGDGNRSIHNHASERFEHVVTNGSWLHCYYDLRDFIGTAEADLILPEHMVRYVYKIPNK